MKENEETQISNVELLSTIQTKLVLDAFYVQTYIRTHLGLPLRQNIYISMFWHRSHPFQGNDSN